MGQNPLALAEKVRFFRRRELPGVDLMSVERSTRLWKTYHTTYVVCVVRKGKGEWLYRRQAHPINPGQLMLMEPGETHVTKRIVMGPCDFKVLLFSPSLVENASQELGVRSGNHHFKEVSAFNPLHCHTFAHLCQGIEVEYAMPMERETRLLECLQLLLSNYVEANPHEERHLGRAGVVRKAREYIVANFSENIPLAQLAREAGASRFHLARLFANEMGMPPHEFQNAIRIAHARRLLREGMSLIQAALTVGFSDQSHLGRHFKKQWAVTPGQYARPPG